MKTVPLNGAKAAGRVALVDDEDYELVMQYRWHVKEQDSKHRSDDFYAAANAKADGQHTTILMHKLITGWSRTDHKDHDGLNNQRSNLRPATGSQNNANQRPRRGTSSRYKGVCWVARTAKWQAYIRANGQVRRLGFFADEIAAARAYDTAARELFGEFACLNRPDLSPLPPSLPRLCGECQGPLPETLRAGTKYCSRACLRAANLRIEMPRRRERHGWRKRTDSRY